MKRALTTTAACLVLLLSAGCKTQPETETETSKSWKVVGTAGFSPGRLFQPSLAIDNGVPYVAYQDGANSDKATVMKFEGGSWQAVGTAGFSPGRIFQPSLAIDNGVPYVAYMNAANDRKATVMKYE